MRAVVTMLLLGLAGCGYRSSDIVSDPKSTITVEQAFVDAGNGITRFEHILQANKVILGMVVCRISVNFNVAAQATEGTKAGLSVTVPVKVISANGSVDYTNDSSANRGNTVSYELGSIYPEFCGTPGGAAASGTSSATSAAAGAAAPTQKTPTAGGTTPPATGSPSKSGSGASPFSEAELNILRNSLGNSRVLLERVSPVSSPLNLDAAPLTPATPVAPTTPVAH